ncbi:MAG: NAD(P)-dependent oxidoreductase, partial [Halocynthiibacter sp.]
MKTGFIGLGNVGGKLSGSLLRNGVDLTVFDLDNAPVRRLVGSGAKAGRNAALMMHDCDVLITCLPNPAASATVVEGPGGLLEGLSPGKIWMEMSTTDETEVKRLGAKVAALGGMAVDCPV